MYEMQRIVDQLHRAYAGNAWHGPAVSEVLAGITAEQAARKPLAGAHSIWDIVNHIAVWESVVRRRLEGERIVELPPEEDWPAVRDTSEAAWKKTLEDLERGHRQLEETISRLSDDRLGNGVFGKDYNVYVMLHGVVQHDLYHAGQIAILKKA